MVKYQRYKTSNVTFRCVCVTITAMKKQLSIKFYECVCVCVSARVHRRILASFLHCIILSPVACLALLYFFTLSHKWHDIWGGEILNIKCA